MSQEPVPTTPAPSALVEHEGSAFDAEHRRRPSRKPWRRFRGWLSWNLVGLVAAVWPIVYTAYCWFVWKTSRIASDEIVPAFLRALERQGRAIGLLWHQEVFTVAWAYRDVHPHTLASIGNFGRIITRMLERCNFVVFRGGSSMGTARRRRVLPLMIRHMRQHPRVAYGITVDGSNGPIYRLKGGILACARACGAPVFVVRCWYKRRIELPTWDRTGIPLPFNHIEMLAIGPYWVPPDADAEQLERIREHLELELLDLCALSYRLVDGPKAEGFVPPGFPEGWRPRWPKGVRGLALGPYDLRPHDPPPWASVPAPQAVGANDPSIDEERGDDEAARAAERAPARAAAPAGAEG